MCAVGVFCLLRILCYFALLAGLVYVVYVGGFFSAMCVHLVCVVYCVC